MMPMALRGTLAGQPHVTAYDGFRIEILPFGRVAEHQRFRYQVFVSEREDASQDYADQKECDAFDVHSVHLMAYRDKTPVGCCRLTFENPGTSDTERLFDIPELDGHRGTLVEVNRVGLARHCRNGRDSAMILRGLFLTAVQVATHLGMEQACFAMPRGFTKILARLGVPAHRCEVYRAKAEQGRYARSRSCDALFPALANLRDVQAALASHAAAAA